MRRTARAHYVTHNAVTRVPRAYVYLDTEARREVGPRSEVQTFRLAVAAFDERRRDSNGWKDRQWFATTDTRALWVQITGWCRRRTRTVLVAHNLAYDLRIGEAFTVLPELGWQFKAGRVDNGQAWFVWTFEGRTLAMVDTLSWVPTSLERLGEAIGVPKLPLPDWEDDDENWFARCVRDVEITATVWRRLMSWVVDEDLGNWKLSGAGQSWAAFRHRFMGYPLLVHEDDDARSAERAAAYTGRCEAWRHGDLTDGPFTEWDFETAYASIGAECLVPTRLCGEIARPNLVNVLTASLQRAVLVECEVTTDEPTLPTRMASGISWPVGTFGATVWSNELAVALEHGARVTVRRAWLYRRAPALRAFCSWVLAGLDVSRVDVDPVVRLALKHWSRALIGRTAAQWDRWEPWGRSPVVDVALADAYHADTDHRFAILQLGHQLIRRVDTSENPDAMVAVMSWVMAECRVRLWRAMQAAGVENVAYVDTDSLIVGPAGDRRLAEAQIPGLRVKGVYETLRVLGPRQIVPGGRLRAAGIPHGAVQTGEATWEAAVWSGLSAGLRAGQASSVQIARRTFELTGRDLRRRHHGDGSTSPFELPPLAAVSGRVTA